MSASARPRISLLANPAAGRGRAARVVPAAIAALAQTCSVTVVDPGAGPAQAVEAIRSAAAARPDAIIICGGDGMVHLTANALIGQDVPFGVIPGGSGNDIAAMLGFGGDPVRAAHGLAAAIAARSVRRIDVGRCDGPQLVPGVDRVFVGLVYAGLDSAVNERANRLRHVPAAARYNVALAIETLRLGARRLRLTLDDAVLDMPATLVAVGNGGQYGGGKRIAPHANWFDAMLAVTVIGPVSRLTLARLAPTLPRAGHVGHPAAHFHAAARVRIEAPGGPGTVAYADGEPIGPLPVTVWVDAAALPVLIPVAEPEAGLVVGPGLEEGLEAAGDAGAEAAA